jgi:hypothetical protein
MDLEDLKWCIMYTIKHSWKAVVIGTIIILLLLFTN